MNYYCGVGSRETPPRILTMMEQIASHFRDAGYTLRSGHAPGADQAFERGASGRAQIFLPWKDFCHDVAIQGTPYFTPDVQATAIARQIHPAWPRLSEGARKLHARNCHQVLGPGLNDPVEFVVCWTKNGSVVGGTATAIRLARINKIPVYNLGRSKDLMVVSGWLTC